MILISFWILILTRKPLDISLLFVLGAFSYASQINSFYMNSINELFQND